MKRNVISIDEDKCNGCGKCVPDCPEGALRIIDGKARLVGDLLCDGLGACIRACPRGAMRVEERDAEPYNERKVMENVAAHGANVIQAHLQHLQDHGEEEHLQEALAFLRERDAPIPKIDSGAHARVHHACPGSAPVDMRSGRSRTTPESDDDVEIATELRQWPVQLKLLNPSAPYFDNAHLLIAADCVAYAYAGFHRRFLRDRIMIMLCPKLDPYVDEYVDKLASIVSMHEIRSITVVRMEVPCCGGVGVILKKAMDRAGKKIPVSEHIITIRGGILHEDPLPAARAL
jgi:Fe-S-cluster-containing hydrogenase component 2